MSTYDAPDFVVSIYNPSFFASDSSTGITQAQAATLFLSKNSADTATALTTFTTGIATNSVSPALSATAMTISSSSNTGAVIIDTGKTGSTNADPAIGIGTSNIAKTIKIGNSNANNSVHIGTLDIAGSSINTTAGTTGAISIGNLQSTGTIDIGSSLITRTGAITIGSVSTNTLPITIGSTSAGSTTTIRNPVTTFSYTATPTYTGIGQTVYTVLNTLGQDPITLGSEQIAISVALPIGVYYIAYSLRICAASTSVISTVTAFNTYLFLTGQTATAGVPQLFAESSQNYSQTAPTVSTATGAAPTINGSTILRVTVAGTLSIRYIISASTALVFYNSGATPRIPYNYLAYCRIG